MIRAFKTITVLALAVAVITAATPLCAETFFEPVTEDSMNDGFQIGQIYAAVNGDRSFTQAVAVVNGDTVVAAYIDDFQFMEKNNTTIGVPNSDGAFGEGYTEGVVLASKRQNSESYSALMADIAGSTTPIDANFDAIQEYAAGKTIEEIDEIAGAADPEDAIDSVSGATLADTANYLKAIADAARAAKNNEGVTFDGDQSALKLNVVYGAPHGDKCFTSAAALTDGTNIVLSYIDDFQFMEKNDTTIGVPNSDGKLGEGFAEGVVLASKRQNTKSYSAHMAEKAGATNTIDANFDAIQSYVDTLTIAEAETLSESDAQTAVDTVSGATLVDTVNYIGLIVEAAK